MSRVTNHPRYDFCCSIILVLVLGFCSCLNMSGALASDPYAIGVKLYREKEYGAAASFLEDAVRKKGPHAASARYLLGNCYMQLERANDAIVQYKESYRMSPKGPQAKHCLTALRQLYSRQKNQPAPAQSSTQGAQEQAQPAPQAVSQASLHQNNVNDLLKKAYTLEQNRRFKESERLYVEGLYQAEKLGSRSDYLSNALDALAGFYLSRRKFGKAAKLYNRLLKVTVARNGRNSVNVLNVKRALAQAYQSDGDLSIAQDIYLECIRRREQLFERAERQRSSGLSQARAELAAAYDDMAGLLAQKGNFDGSQRYTNLAVKLRQQEDFR